jgi:hypothetical protein
MRSEGEEARPSRGKEVVCIEILDNSSQQFNATLFQPNGLLNPNDTKLDEVAKRIVIDNKEKFEAMALCVGRMHTSGASLAGSGVAFAIAPGMIRTSLMVLPTCRSSTLTEQRFALDLSL